VTYSGWQNLPRTRLLADVSLWSADLANLAAAIERIEPFADSFHFDISDARFSPSLLFFPDLVRALRPLTKRPFHIHLMVDRPTALIEDFVAGEPTRSQYTRKSANPKRLRLSRPFAARAVQPGWHCAWIRQSPSPVLTWTASMPCFCSARR
jgi:hypothetical protein